MQCTHVCFQFLGLSHVHYLVIFCHLFCIVLHALDVNLGNKHCALNLSETRIHSSREHPMKRGCSDRIRTCKVRLRSSSSGKSRNEVWSGRISR